MKRVAIITVAAIIFTSFLMTSLNVAKGNDGKLTWKTFDEGLKEAQRTNKKVLIDVYTDWCGWCKKMDANTYSSTRVASYLSEHFVPVKLNAESSRKLTYDGQNYTEQELAGAFGISGYPSTVFLKTTGEPITVFPGYADAVEFEKVLSFIAEDYYLKMKFGEYKSGRR